MTNEHKKVISSKEDVGDIVGDKVDSLDKKLKDMNYTLIAVIIVLIVMVASMIIESFRFNSMIYSEYSKKLDLIQETHNINNIILENQHVLTEQIEDIINKTAKVKD